MNEINEIYEVEVDEIDGIYEVGPTARAIFEKIECQGFQSFLHTLIP